MNFIWGKGASCMKRAHTSGSICIHHQHGPVIVGGGGVYAALQSMRLFPEIILKTIRMRGTKNPLPRQQVDRQENSFELFRHLTSVRHVAPRGRIEESRLALRARVVAKKHRYGVVEEGRIGCIPGEECIRPQVFMMG